MDSDCSHGPNRYRTRGERLESEHARLDRSGGCQRVVRRLAEDAMSERAAAVAPAPVRSARAPSEISKDVSQQLDASVEEPTSAMPSRGGFAGLPSGSVIDADVQRRLTTQRLIQQLAPALGLDPRSIRVEVQDSGRARLDAAGAHGLQEGTTIWLHSTHYRPNREEGRYLLGHEAAHAAQRQLTGPGNEDAAEAEARTLGRQFAVGRLPRRPRMSLVRARAAADSGAKEDSPPKVDSDMVKVSRSRELAVIRDALGGLWVSDGDVFTVLRILDSVPYSVIKPMLMALEEKERFWLADNINPPHIYKHRRSVLACYYDTLRDERLRDAMDLKVLRALPPSGLATEEIQAAAWTLQHLSQDQRRELLQSNSGPAIAAIIMAPRPSSEELKRLKREADNAARDEAALADKRRAIAAMEKDSEANDLFSQVERLLSPRLSDHPDPRPTGAQARAALDLLATARANQPKLLYVAELMEQAGLIDNLLELLPASSYFDTAGHSGTLLDLVQSRLPYKNEELIERLLSYGLFDWAIRDYEALFAYRMIRLLPLTDQYKFRLRDGGKWYLRLLDNLPDDPESKEALPGIEIRRAESREEIARLRELGATEIDEKQLLYNASQVYEKKRKDTGTQEVIQTLIAAFEEANEGIFRDTEAKDLFRRLRALGASSLTPGQEKPADDVLRETVVHELDSRGWIDRLFKELPDSFLFAEENRIDTVKLMMARDPTRAQAHARNLVSRGFANWMVTDGEAWLAYQCIKALPEDERSQFIAQEPELWDRVKGEMSESQRQARDLNMYIGDRAGVDRASVLGRLAEGATWSEKNVSLLDDLVRMAIAMTEHRFAFERSREFNAIAKAALAPLVEKYRLWDPQRRDTYKPDILQGLHWYEEGVFASLKQFGGAIATLATADFLYVDRKVGVRVDLGYAQTAMGGDLMGAKLDRSKPVKDEPSRRPDANKISLFVNPSDKSVELILPELVLESANVQLGSSTLQSGAVTLKGLRVSAAYDSEQLLQPARAEAKIESLVANDLLLAKASSMVTATRLIVSALRLAAGTLDTVSPGDAARRREGSMPVPLLLGLILPHLLLLALPAYLIYKVYSFVSSVKNQGLEDPGHSFADDLARDSKAISFTLGSLDVESLTTSGGQHVGHASVRDFSVFVGLNKVTRLRAQSRSLKQRIDAIPNQPTGAMARETLQKQRAKVDAEVATAQGEELEYLAIMREIRGGDVSPQRQNTLQARLDALKFDEQAGAFIDIGAVEVSDLSGTVTAKDPVRIANVHGEGGGTALSQLLSSATSMPVGTPVVTNEEVNRRSGAGERPAQDGRLTLDLGDINTGEVRIGGGLRTVRDIDQEIATLESRKEANSVRPLYEALQELRPKAARYELMQKHGVSQLDDKQLAEFRQLRVDLAAKADLVMQSLAIVHAKLDADVASGRIGLSADSLTATGVDSPVKGMHVDSIVARGLGVSALPKGGFLAWADPGKALKDAEGHIDSVEITGARSKYHGLLFEKATLTGAYARLGDRGDELAAGVGQLAVEQVGVAPQIGLMQQRLNGLREKARIAAPPAKGKLEAEMSTLESKIATLQSLVDARMSAALRLDAAKTPTEIEAAKQAVAEADATIVVGLAQYGATRLELDEFGVKATGAGDIISDALEGGIDPWAVLGRGSVHVTGTGPGNRVFERFAVKSAYGSDTPRGDPRSMMSGELGSFEIGPTRLDLTARRDGDAIVVDVPKFSIASVAIDRFELTSSGDTGVQMWSDGTSSIEDISFQGSLRLQSRVKNSQDLADYRIAGLHVDEARIGRIQGNGLGVALSQDKIQVAIQSGALNGIHVDDFDVIWPEDPKASPQLKGKAGIESIDKLVVGESFAGAWRVGGGRIDARQLDVELLEDGGVKASIGSLSLSSFAVRGPDGWVRFTLADLRGRINVHGNDIGLEEFHVGSLVVPAMHWSVGKTGFVEADQPVTLSGLHVDASAKLEDVEAQPTDGAASDKKEKRLASAHIKSLRVDKVDARHLVYQDENNRVEIGPPPVGTPVYMKDFKPLTLESLIVTDLTWDRAKGITMGGGSLKSYEASANVTGLHTALKLGVALKGGGMSARVTTPGVFGIDIGKVEKVRGTYEDGSLKTRFGTQSITGGIELGPNYVAVNDLDVGGAGLVKTEFNDGSRSLGLHHVIIDRIKLGKLRRNYEISTDEKTKGEKVPTTLEVENLEFFGITAGQFAYRGGSKGTAADGTEISSTQDVKADSATIEHLIVSRLVYDARTAETVMSMKVDNVDPKRKAWAPIEVNGLAATLVDRAGSEETKIHLATQVEGGPLEANNIKFGTVDLGSGRRTKIEGEFQLTRLGFINPNLTLTDAKGVETKISPDEYGTIELKNLNSRFLPNHTALVSLESLKANNLLLTRGGIRVRVPMAELQGFALAMKGLGTEKGIELLAAGAKSLTTKDLTVTIDVDRNIDSSDEGFKKRHEAWERAIKHPDPGHALIAEPIGGLSGDLEVEAEHVNLLWKLNLPWDPNLTLPIRGGKINFDHVYPYAVNLRKGHLTLGDFGPEKKIGPDLPPELQGVHPDAGKHGMLNLRETLEGLFAPSTPKEPEKNDEPADLSALKNVNLGAPSLSLGSGKLGVDLTDDKTLAPGDLYLDVQRDDPSQNVITIPWQHIGDRIDLDLQHLHAQGAGLPGFGGLPAGKSGAVDVFDLHVGIAGLANLNFTITVYVKEAKVVDVQFGEVRLLNVKDTSQLEKEGTK
jgi:hypothetical protein